MKMLFPAIPLIALACLLGCPQDAKADLLGDVLKIEEAAKILSGQMDKSTRDLIEVLLKTLREGKEESKEFRETLLKITGQLGITADNLVGAAGTESRAFVDFVLMRLKDNAACVIKLTKALNEGKYRDAIIALSELRDGVNPGRPPEIIRTAPSNIALDHTGAPETTSHILKLYGYDFKDRAKKVQAFVLDENDRQLREVTKHFRVLTDKEASLDISPGSGVSFTAQDRTIMFMYDGKMLGQASITWSKRAEPGIIEIALGQQGPLVPTHEAYRMPLEEAKRFYPSPLFHRQLEENAKKNGGFYLFPKGDTEFSGHVKIKVRAEARLEKGAIETRLHMEALEWKNGRPWPDFTFFKGTGEWRVAYTPPANTKILEIASATTLEKENVDPEDDHRDKALNFPNGELLRELQYVGDVKGDDLGHTRIKVAVFNPMKIKVIKTP